jgi:ABC-type Fe3+ transport system permease subunit
VAVLASAFAIVFGIFVAALAMLSVVIVTWAVRRDRSRWREWKDRQPR